MTFRPTSKVSRNRPFHALGFSLVEVTLAIGIVAFALLAITGLLPVGLKSLKESDENAAAGALLQMVTDSIRHAATTDNQTFIAETPAGQIVYTINEASEDPATAEVFWNNLTLHGGMESSASPRRLALWVEITPPTRNASQIIVLPGVGRISVAWSAQADLECTNGVWSGADGSLSTTMLFLPK
jgi:uncharacterized protein (TIGR02598 family)